MRPTCEHCHCEDLTYRDARKGNVSDKPALVTLVEDLACPDCGAQGSVVRYSQSGAIKRTVGPLFDPEASPVIDSPGLSSWPEASTEPQPVGWEVIADD